MCSVHMRLLSGELPCATQQCWDPFCSTFFRPEQVTNFNGTWSALYPSERGHFPHLMKCVFVSSFCAIAVQSVRDLIVL